MSQYDPFRYSNLSPQMVSDMIVGNVEQTPALLSQYDVNNDGTISMVDQQIIQNNQNQMAGSGMQFADMNMPMVTPASQQTQIQTPSQAMPINNMGQGQVQQQQQPQTMGQGQINYGSLNVQQALDLSTGASEMTPAFMKQYDLNQDGTVNITDVSNLITGKENIAKQNLSPYGSQVYNPQVQMATQSQAKSMMPAQSQAMPAQAASPAMAAAMAQQQNPFARPMEDGGIVYMEKGEDPEGVIDKLTGKVTGWAQGVADYLAKQKQTAPNTVSKDLKNYQKNYPQGGTGFGNILDPSTYSMDNLKTGFTNIGDAEQRAAYNALSLADQQAVQGLIDIKDPFGGSQAEEEHSKYQAAYKRAIAKGDDGAAGFGDYIRGRGDVRADYFIGTEFNKNLDPNLHDTSIYNQVLQGKNVDGTILVGYTNKDGIFQPLIANDAKRALDMGIVEGYGYTPETHRS
jgi:hypothetical protein